MKHNGKEVKLIFTPFPAEVQGACQGFLMECGTCYKIGIDSTRCQLQQRHAIGHEIAHLLLNHLDQHDRPIREQEQEANREAWNYYRFYKSLPAAEKPQAIFIPNQTNLK